MRRISQGSFDTVECGDTLLVLSPAFGETGPTTCSTLLCRDSSGEDHVLCITFTRSPADYLVDWRHHGNVPERATFVRVDASSRASGEFNGATGDEGPDDVDVTVERTASPENLTRLGVEITEVLESEADEVTDREVRVCFDSVTALLQYVGLDEAFRFLHVLTDQFAEAGAKAHFHMDPGAHDEETVQTLLAVFDETRAFEDGEWVRKR